MSDNQDKKQPHGVRQRASEPATEHTQAGSKIISRRNAFMGIGALAAGGAITYYRTQKKEAPPPQALDTATQGDVSNFASIDDGVKIYKDLEKSIAEKFLQAKQENPKKPFRVFILESHENTNALAYELMALDILTKKKYGIKLLLAEAPDKNLSPLKNLSDSEISPEHVHSLLSIKSQNPPFYLAAALAKRYELKGVDNEFDTPEKETARVHELLEQLVEREIQAPCPGAHNVINKIVPGPNGTIGIGFDSRFMGSLNAQQYSAVLSIAERAPDEAMSLAVQERNASIIASVDKERRDAIVILGADHGMDVLSHLRKNEEKDATFSLFSPTLEADSYLQQAELWAADSKNATQYTGKNFNPENLPLFIDRVIEKANSPSLGRQQ